MHIPLRIGVQISCFVAGPVSWLKAVRRAPSLPAGALEGKSLLTGSWQLASMMPSMQVKKRGVVALASPPVLRACGKNFVIGLFRAFDFLFDRDVLFTLWPD